MKNIISFILLTISFLFNGQANLNLQENNKNISVYRYEYLDIDTDTEIVKQEIKEIDNTLYITEKPYMFSTFTFEDISNPYLDHSVFCDPINSKDGNPLTTGIDDLGFCTPGLVTNGTWFTSSPEYVYGSAVYYAPGVMEGTARWRQLYKEAYESDFYIGGVAVPSPANIGDTVWIRRPDNEWEGPFLVVDCSRRADMYSHIVYNQQVVEVDFRTALSWGLVTTNWNVKDTGAVVWYPVSGKEPIVELHYGKDKPSENILSKEQPIYFTEYWLNNVVEFMQNEIELQPWLIEFGINPVWDLRDGKGGQCFTMECRGE